MPTTTPLSALPATQRIAAASGTIYVGAAANPVDANADFIYTPTAAGKSFVFDTTATQPLIIRQLGGTPGTDELQISHNGSKTILESKDGPIALASDLDANTDGGQTIGATNRFLIRAYGIGSTGVDAGMITWLTDFRLEGGSLALGSSIHFGWSSGNAQAAAKDTGLIRAAATVVSVTNGSSGSGWLQNSAGESRRTATQTVTDSASLTADNTLTATLIAGRKYRFRIRYYMTTVNTSGVQVDLNGGTATMTAINGFTTIRSSTGAVLNGGQISALTTSVGHTATGTFALVEVEGSMQCNAAGTFIPRFAQNAETGAAESVVAQVGSFMELGDVP